MKNKSILLLGILPLVLMGENSVIGSGTILSNYENIVSNVNHSGPYPYGVTKDTTVLHPINNKNVGFFQWLVNKGSCERLKISTTTNNQKVNITVGSWSVRSKDRTFKNVSLPFVFGKENVKNSTLFEDGQWIVTGIEFLNKIGQKENLYAECTQDSETSASYEIGIPLMLGEYRWNGNGSIISGYFDSHYNSWNNVGLFGIFKDVSKVYPNVNKQMVLFQHLKSDVCPNLTIDVLGASSSEKRATLMYKNWSAENYIEKSVTLPYTLSPNNTWTVVGVKFDNRFSTEYQVEASCSTGTNQENIKPLNLNHKSMSDISKHPNGCKFNDVDENAWYSKYIKSLCLSGIVQGYGHTGYTEYRPANYATWAEVAKVVNLANDYETTFEKCRTTNNSEYWYECYIDIAKSQGFYISDDSKVRRGVALKYFAKIFFNQSFNRWSDAGNFFKNKGIINGTNNSGIIDSDYLNTFMNRAELAKIALNSVRVASDESSASEKKEIPYGLVEEKVSSPEKSIHKEIDNSQEIPKSSIPQPPSKDLDEISFGKKVLENVKKLENKKSIFAGKETTSDVDFVTTIIGKGVEKEEKTAVEYCDKFNLKSTGKAGDGVCYEAETPGTNGEGHIAISDGKGNEIGVVATGEPIQKRKTDIANVEGYIPSKDMSKK